MSEENEFTWTVKADLPAVRNHSTSAVARDGKLWLIGGLDEHGDGTDTVFIYDPEHDSWAPGPTLPFILRGGRAAMHSGELHVMTRSWYPEDRVRFCIYRDGAWLEVPDMVFNSGFGTCQSLVLG